MDTETRAFRAYAKLIGAAELLTARMSHRLADTGVTLSQFNVLELLHRVGPINQTDIARKLLKTPGNVTCVVDNLEKHGMVRRERCLEDRRVCFVHITEMGRALVEEEFPVHVHTIAEEMSVLTQDEQDQLSRLCRRIGKRDLDAAQSAPDDVR